MVYISMVTTTIPTYHRYARTILKATGLVKAQSAL